MAEGGEDALGLTEKQRGLFEKVRTGSAWNGTGTVVGLAPIPK